ncbi:hypothetical protein JX265_008684 [Neoarthrinium moseri]|uniref:alpha-galactosidase n=1 Tax=Neoarthrinium moseri TaxID=1658444 RepID=A0A9Q0AK28_9PEZI|nr:uncharacterized protein JN550_013281 [Neoarthrinium moseri]KAI1845701.1 hypothetical protein JX266_008066 [Neoarthrinium moseri]KAI1857346.1 hypothetical protein JN550_013281 [Neoarthrinium moseri]KAI1864313.1 hypothetical protein JX265_008684 [Neoarthrinium moseri]
MLFRKVSSSLLPLLHTAVGSPAPSRSSEASLRRAAATIPQGAKWQIEIHDPLDFSGSGPLAPADAKVWTLDLWNAIKKGDDGKTTVQKLRERNGNDIVVICYFNGGGVQIWDEDYDAFANYKYGGLPGWEGEYYVDVSAPEVVRLMRARVANGIAGGCDGFDPDNVDAYSQGLTSKDGKTKLDEAAYVAFLAALAEPIHAAGKLLGQKNAGDLTEALLAGGTTDFAVLEGCIADNFCEDFRSAYVEKGLAVLQIEYPASVQLPESEEDNEDAVCPTAKASEADFRTVCGSPIQGFSTVIKHDGGVCGLDGFVEYCDGSVVITPTEK